MLAGIAIQLGPYCLQCSCVDSLTHSPEFCSRDRDLHGPCNRDTRPLQSEVTSPRSHQYQSLGIDISRCHRHQTQADDLWTRHDNDLPLNSVRAYMHIMALRIHPTSLLAQYTA